MIPKDKNSEILPQVRVPAAMREQLMRLAYAADRSPSDYIRWVLSCHVYGHARSVGDGAAVGEECNATQCVARNSSRGKA